MKNRSKEFLFSRQVGKAMGNWPAVKDEAARYGQSAVTVEEFTEKRYVSNQQMAYLHAVVFPTYAKEMHCSVLWAEIELKRCCGEQWMIVRVDKAELILSKTILTVDQCTQWIENIIDWTESKNIHIPLPEKNWYETKP